ncbi:phosphotransferase [Tenggerimyces flavus]|uniref:Phosphotransferase n=1 Tax=Tenggerimyces flavus TaxID=1708749 RepID=A0ABV7YCA6_9ACTN|nr:phosphotransferase [Tenggerimyces flavus]MBM7787061.1 homoserine kinase type II [Tenggerimyces flavus]
MREVAGAFGLGDVLAVAYLPNGMMNRNWRVETSSGTYAIKQLRDVEPDPARRQHDTIDQLAAAGLPVPRVVRTGEGDSVVEVDGLSYAASQWMVGEHREGATLAIAECVELGGLLGVLHHELERVLPDVPDQVEVRVRDHGGAVADAERYLALIAAKDEPDTFDRLAERGLIEGLELLAKYRDRAPKPDIGGGGWIHGDFNHFNVLWEAGSVRAVLDWDRLKAAPRGMEVARAAELLFWQETTFDLKRMAAFIGGYRAVAPIDSSDLLAGLQLRWWNLLCGFWPLDAHYDRNDLTCDHLFEPRCARLAWWCSHEDELIAAATAR